MFKNQNKFSVIGLMSGTSLDGLDMAYCRFIRKKRKWFFCLVMAKTEHYSLPWKKRLSGASLLNGEPLIMLHRDYGKYCAILLKKFISRNHISLVNFISSHGHTVFHQPGRGVTFQIGDGAVMAAVTGIPAITDFRSGDVVRGGEGAPLVPVGDELLFPQYDYCLNLGGFANISFRENKKRIAFDICPCNILLNRLSGMTGKEFDRNGSLARKGNVNIPLLKKLNRINYYRLPPPKSLGREWAENAVFPLFVRNRCSPEGKLRTAAEHIAQQIARAITRYGDSEKKKILMTGGGAHNRFLVERIGSLCTAEIILPEKKIIDFKEALIFGFLGVLRWRGEKNCLKSVTGAERDSVGGCIYF
ncbi:MAG: anhydro-N-acetylmuramic acid kinase [Bacteroidetes bacterium]|nr:anhydro-N-acetylmuramic acid kinase [Bacteroidota bacterium]